MEPADRSVISGDNPGKEFNLIAFFTVHTLSVNFFSNNPAVLPPHHL